MMLYRLVLLVLLAGLATPAAAGEFPTTPFPAVETGMHGAAINRIDLSADMLATVADDKTVRLWRLSDGDLTATVRVPGGSGNEGKLYAVAMQPHGKLVVAAGWTGVEWDGGSFFYLIDRTTSRVVGRVGPFPSTINHLAFSDDGRLLAVAFAGKVGLKVYDLKANRQVFQDDGFKDAVTWADFAADDRLAVTALDGTVKLYGPDFKPLSVTRTAGKQPFSVAFSGDGATVAVGYLDAARVTLHGGRDLAPRGEFTGPTGKTGNLSVVTFADGALYAGGTLGSAAGVRSVLRWQLSTGKAQDIAVGTDTVVDLRPLPGGGIAFATAEPAWGLIDAGGQIRQRHQRGFADLRDGYRESFLLSRDGATISFGLQQGGRKPLMKDIARELNVDAVIEGSVLRSGDRVRITVQLIHGATDRHLWAESYQRDVRDIITLQSEVGLAIANEIRIKLTPQEQGLLTSARPVNPQALDAYLKGRDFFNQGRNKGRPEGPELRKTSIVYFEQAIRIQPDYALAYADLARANHWLGNYPQA